MSHLQTVAFQRFGIVASASDLDALAAYIVSQHPAVTLDYDALHAVEHALAGIPPGPTDTLRGINPTTVIIDGLDESTDTDQSAAVAAIEFALDDDDGMDFLRYWNEGEFDVLRRNWPDAPESVYIGADPLLPKTII